MKKIFIFLVAAFLVFSVFEEYSEARAGRSGGGSFGSRGSRTYSAPAKNTASPAQQQTAQKGAYQQPMPQQPFGGGFMRSLAGGLVGGMIGSLLFSSLGHAAGVGQGGFGGVGLLDILLIGGGIFLLVRMLKPKHKGTQPPVFMGSANSAQNHAESAYSPAQLSQSGVNDIKMMDAGFNEKDFMEAATDIFFKVQTAWRRREMEEARECLSPETLKLMSKDVAEMKRKGRVNCLENIAVKDISITEAWQEEGLDYITVSFSANVLDYVTDEQGALIEGSKTEPVKFMEYWTFVRDIGHRGWKLSAIQQDI